MRLRLRSLPLLLASLLAAAPASTQGLHGRVVDAATGAPVAGAQLTLLEPGGSGAAAAHSAADGRFRLAAPSPGSYRVSAHRLGYRVTLTREVELSEGMELEVELRMAPAPLALDTARVRAGDRAGVHGRVLDDSTGLPVAGATVALLTDRNRTIVRARTDERGEFSLQPRSAGNFRVRATAGGFIPSDTRALSLTPDDTVRLEVRISRNVVLLAPVTVVAAPSRLLRDDQLAGFEWRRRQMVGGRFVGPEQIRHINPFLTSDVLQHVPFVRVTGGFRRQVLLRDPVYRGYCSPEVYVDGNRMPMAGAIPLDDLVAGTTVAAVEVYDRPSSAPMEFSTSKQCGVVVVWTRPPGEPAR